MAGEPLFLEDLEVGQVFRSGTHRLTADEIKDFARRFDPQPFHLDEGAAQGTFFGGLAASGFHTAATTMRLIVESLPLAGGVIGTGGEIRWPKPTRPGDALRVETEILDIVPSRSRPELGTAQVRCTTLNEAGEVVQVFSPRVTLRRRP